MGVRVTHDLDNLADDLARIAAEAKPKLSKVVKRNVEAGNRIAVRLAREKSGPHGKNYYKRLSAEMTGPLQGEYGPEGIPKSDFVGAGFRHGVNLDLPNSADLIGPKFGRDVLDEAGSWFW